MLNALTLRVNASQTAAVLSGGGGGIAGTPLGLLLAITTNGSGASDGRDFLALPAATGGVGLITITATASPALTGVAGTAALGTLTALNTDPTTHLLLHLDGTNGSTTFTDSSQYAHTMAVYGGTPALTTSQKKFGTAGLDLSGPGSILGPTDGSLALGNGNFVVDHWFKSSAGNGNGVMVDWGFNTLGTNCPVFLIDTSAFNLYWYVNGAFRISAAGVPNDGGWHHYAAVRSSGVTRLFIDGVQAGSDYTDANNYAVDTSIGGPCYGSAVGHGSASLGFYDEVRLSVGTDRGWFSGFTPPSAPYGN